jgi:hypothetical protein
MSISFKNVIRAIICNILINVGLFPLAKRYIIAAEVATKINMTLAIVAKASAASTVAALEAMQD